MTAKKHEEEVKQEEVKIGDVSLDVKIEGGKVVATASFDPSKALDKLASFIPGTIDDKVIQAVKLLLAK